VSRVLVLNNPRTQMGGGGEEQQEEEEEEEEAREEEIQRRSSACSQHSPCLVDSAHNGDVGGDRQLLQELHDAGGGGGVQPLS